MVNQSNCGVLETAILALSMNGSGTSMALVTDEEIVQDAINVLFCILWHSESRDAFATDLVALGSDRPKNSKQRSCTSKSPSGTDVVSILELHRWTGVTVQMIKSITVVEI